MAEVLAKTTHLYEELLPEGMLEAPGENAGSALMLKVGDLNSVFMENLSGVLTLVFTATAGPLAPFTDVLAGDLTSVFIVTAGLPTALTAEVVVERELLTDVFGGL